MKDFIVSDGCHTMGGDNHQSVAEVKINDTMSPVSPTKSAIKLSKPSADKKVPPKGNTKPAKGSMDPFVKFMFALCIVTLVWIVITTFSPKPVGLLNKSKWICARPTVCAEDWWSLVLLAISRSSAYFCYPLMMMLFLSKANNLRTLLQRTPLSMFIPFYDLHHIHTLAGAIVGTDVMIHGTCHMIRWGLQNNIEFIWTTHTGRSGVLAMAITPLITWPMLYPRFKKALSWEWRKGLHYLSIAWGFCAMFHAPQMHIIYLMGIPVVTYLLDYVIGYFWRTYLVESSTFKRLECGVELSFEHPPGFTSDGTGYVMVCVPWISKYQWHAFSLFAHPSKPNHSCVCMCKNGDWTTELHASVQQPTTRPVWIAGPFASPYATAIKYDNLIVVASGIGITPAMSIITTHKETRRINLVWSCREPSLLEFYLQNCEFDDDAWTLIFYTGKRKLKLDFPLPKSVLIMNGRPVMEKTVMEIVTGIESGAGLPEELEAEAAAQRRAMKELAAELKLGDDESAADPYQKFTVLLRRCLDTYSFDELVGFIGDREEDAVKGFNMDEVLETLMPEAFNDDEKKRLASRFDSDGDGTVDLREFQQACYGVLSSMMDLPAGLEAVGSIEDLKKLHHSNSSSNLKRSESSADIAKSKFTGKAICESLQAAIDAVPKDRFETWQMLYCGGAQPVVDALTEVSNKYNIAFKAEKFDW